jgi:hypothetical protein
MKGGDIYVDWGLIFFFSFKICSGSRVRVPLFFGEIIIYRLPFLGERIIINNKYNKHILY